MNIKVRQYTKEDVTDATGIWNKVVFDGVAFPQTEPLDEKSGDEFFSRSPLRE